jgi:hypothetical protein
MTWHGKTRHGMEIIFYLCLESDHHGTTLSLNLGQATHVSQYKVVEQPVEMVVSTCQTLDTPDVAAMMDNPLEPSNFDDIETDNIMKTLLNF